MKTAKILKFPTKPVLEEPAVISDGLASLCFGMVYGVAVGVVGTLVLQWLI